LKEHLQGSDEKNKEDGDDEEGSKDGPRESQEKIEEETLLLVFC